MNYIGLLANIMKNMNTKSHIFILRILGGRLKGRGIKMVPQEYLRPSKTIIRESFFGRMHAEIEGKTFFELFAGSGSMGFEALSRGARHIIFTEHNKAIFQQLHKNCLSLDVLNDVELYYDDVFSVFGEIILRHSDLILYIDPPFPNSMQTLYEKCFSMLQSYELKQVHCIVFEAMSSVHMPTDMAGFSLELSRQFGKSTLHYYRR